MNHSPNNAIINRSITRRLMACLIITVLIVSVIAVTAMHRVVSQAALRSMENKADEMIAYLTGTLEIPLWSVAEETVRAIGKAASHDESIARLIIKDESGTVVYSMEKKKNGGLINRSRGIFHTQELIEKRVGDVSVSLTPALYNENNRRLLVFSALIIVLIMIAVAIVTIMFIRTALSRPLKSLNEITSLFASGIYDTSGHVLPYLEFQPFGRALAEMAGKIEGQIRMIQEEITERIRVEETLHRQTAELEEEVAERQVAQENLQEKALLLEEEIEKRQKAQEELERLNDELEQRVQERTAELEDKNAELHKMNRLFVGRELKMVELKERIRELENNQQERNDK